MSGVKRFGLQATGYATDALYIAGLVALCLSDSGPFAVDAIPNPFYRRSAPACPRTYVSLQPDIAQLEAFINVDVTRDPFPSDRPNSLPRHPHRRLTAIASDEPQSARDARRPRESRAE